MNWYRLANQEEIFAGDMEDMVSQQAGYILSEYFSPNHKPGGMMSWSVIPIARVNKIWRDYAKTGVVRDEKGLMGIQEDMLRILARLEASNRLAGHSQMDSSEMFESHGYEPVEDNDTDFGFLETQYGAPVSDYGLPQLWKLSFQLVGDLAAEERLLVLDQMLNVVHQRGDLAALFVEGGAGALTDLSA